MILWYTKIRMVKPVELPNFHIMVILTSMFKFSQVWKITVLHLVSL